MNYRVKIGRIALLLAGTLGAIILGATLLKEEISVVELDVNKPEISQDDITVDDSQITIKSFKSGVEEIAWLDEENIAISGEIEGFGQGKYSFNLNHNLLERFQSDETLIEQVFPDEMSDYSFITNVVNDRLLLTDKDLENDHFALYVMNADGGYRTLTENCYYKGVAKYTYSKNRDKIVFYDANEGRVKTYGVKSKQLRSMKDKLPGYILENFDETLKMSSNGGYLMVVFDSKLYPDNSDEQTTIEDDLYFSVYGADSGRIYGDKIYGINPTWTNDESKIAYFYTPESEISYKENNQRIVTSKRVGVLKLSNKDITYIDSPLNSKLAINQLIWSETDNNLIYLAGNYSEDNELVIDSIMNYNYLKRAFVNNDSTMSDIFKAEQEYQLLMMDKYLGVLSRSQDAVSLKLFDEYSNFISEEKNLQLFKVNSESNEVYYHKKGKDFVTFDGEKLLIRNNESESYINIEQESPYVVHMSDESRALCINYYNSNILMIVKQ